MIVIGDVLISEEVLTEQFHCQLNACKGACCWEGDYGAPINDKEKLILDTNLEKIKSFLPTRSVEYLENNKAYKFYSKPKVWATPCHDDGACVYLTTDEVTGIAKCGIEKAFEHGAIDFQKPISCHLYPIRVSKNDIVGFEAWNYDRWDICNAACSFGKEKQIPIYQFVKDAIIRLKGPEFYEQLDANREYIEQKLGKNDLNS